LYATPAGSKRPLQIAINKTIRDQRLHGIATLVAFSDKSATLIHSLKPFSRKEPDANPIIRGRDLREAFDTDEYQRLLVANKFQNRFDQAVCCVHVYR